MKLSSVRQVFKDLVRSLSLSKLSQRMAVRSVVAAALALALVFQVLTAPAPGEAASCTSQGNGSWNNDDTWGVDWSTCGSAPDDTVYVGHTVTVDDAVSIASRLWLDPDGIVSLNAPLTIGVDLFLSTGTLQIGSSELTLNGVIVYFGGTLIGGVSSSLTFGGSGSSSALGEITLNNLTINRANGIYLDGDVTLAGLAAALTLTSGNITTGSNTVIINSTGSVSRTSGHVVGNLQKNVATGATSRTFEIGDASSYTPVTVAFGSVSDAGDLTAKATSGDHLSLSDSGLDSSKSVNRYWTLTNSVEDSVAFTSYSAAFTFVAGDKDPGVNTAYLVVARLASGTWSSPALGTRTATTSQGTGLTAFGDFQLAQTVWESYNDAARTAQDDDFGAGQSTVFMKGSGYLTSGSYVVGYYAANGDKKCTETLPASSGALNSSCDFLIPAASGTWHAVAFDPGITAPVTYGAIDTDDHRVISDDNFIVQSGAILPEVPSVIATILIGMATLGVFYWFSKSKSRRRGGRLI